MLLGWFTALATATPVADLAIGALPPRPGVDRWVAVRQLARGGKADRNGYGPRGTVVQLRPTIDGVPVDALAAVVVSPDGRIRRIRTDPWPDHRAAGPSISREQAVALGLATGAGARPSARLSWQPVGPSLRQVWTIDLATSGHPDLVAPRVRIDGLTGRVLSIGEGVVHATVPRGLAFPDNPAIDPEPIEVDLPWVTDTLEDPEVEVFQCRDLGETEAVWYEAGRFDLRVCTEDAPATASDGDFLYDPVPWPSDPAIDEDDFAGPHMLWNVHRGLDWFGALGWVPTTWTGLPGVPLHAVVNYRVTDLTSEATATEPDHRLAPYPNAFFSGSFSDDPSRIVFGQADPVDFAYDADVIFHELGHYVVYTYSALLFSEDTAFGPSHEASTLNEGLADYFSSAIQGHGALGEYAADDRGLIRDLDGPEGCATHLYGEPHYDSLPFSTALWSVRRDLDPADRSSFDLAILEGLAELGLTSDLLEATDVFTDQVAEVVGTEAADALDAAFRSRGVHACVPRIEAESDVAPLREFGVIPMAHPYVTEGRIPAYIQYRVDIPPGGATVTLRFAQREFLGFAPDPIAPVPLSVVGRSGYSVRWTVESVEVERDGYRFLVDAWSTNADDLGEPEAVGSRPVEEGSLYRLHDYALSWDVVRPGLYAFQLTNEHPDATFVIEPTVEVTSLLVVPGEPDRAACGCATGSGSPVWMIGIMALGLRRRT